MKTQNISQIETNAKALEALKNYVLTIANNTAEAEQAREKIAEKATSDLTEIYNAYIKSKTETEYIEFLGIALTILEREIIARAPLNADRKAINSKIRVYKKRFKDRIVKFARGCDDCPEFIRPAKTIKIVNFDRDQMLELIGKAIQADALSVARHLFNNDGKLKGNLGKLGIGTLRVQTDDISE